MKYLLALLFVFYFTVAGAQDSSMAAKNNPLKKQTDVYPAFVIGYQYYGRSGVELGFGRFTLSVTGHHPLTTLLYGSVEMAKYNQQFLWAPKIGVWAAGGAGGSMGISAVHYIHSMGNSLKLRPEIGYGAMIMRFYYARNLSVTNKEFWPISKNMFGLNIAIPASKKFFSYSKR
jgi:hypothetical protein